MNFPPGLRIRWWKWWVCNWNGSGIN